MSSHLIPTAGDAGLLLVGHGTRDPAGLEEVRSVAQQAASVCPQLIVEHCFLELAAPGIARGIETCVQRGVRRLVIQPLLLFAAGHAKADIPAEVHRARDRYPAVQIVIAPHLGCHPQLLELSELRYAAALAGRPAVADAETLLLLVGRGSRDPEANSELVCFSRLRWERRRLGRVETCFMALTWPSLAEGLAAATKLAQRRIVVQPHLLFRGELLTRIYAEAGAAAARDPDHEWIMAHHLGPHSLLAAALLDRSRLDRSRPEHRGF